ncbi:MAG: M48 family metallopeptidase [Planctomycetia bacterium]|nr:M48 family metallopeptidase [Planctomycetia bacterium]
MKIEIKMNGMWIEVTEGQMMQYVLDGKITSGTLVKLNGQTGLAGQIKGLSFPAVVSEEPKAHRTKKDNSVPIADASVSLQGETPITGGSKEFEPRQDGISGKESGTEQESFRTDFTSGASSLFDRDETLLTPLDSQDCCLFKPRTIDYKQFIHPLDRQALDALEAIPGLANLSKLFLKQFSEKLYSGLNLASSVRISTRQLPEIHNYLAETCETIGIDVPEMYLALDPYPNAYTMGDTKPFITLTSGLVDLFPPDELKCVIAHECGHILCHHVLYTTLAHFIAGAGSMLISSISLPLQLGLAFWSRRSEFSADRVAAYVMGSESPVVKTMLRLACGSSRVMDKIDIEEYVKQTENYSDLIDNSLYDKALQSCAIAFQDHPFGSIRSREIRAWYQTAKDRLPAPAKRPF